MERHEEMENKRRQEERARRRVGRMKESRERTREQGVEEIEEYAHESDLQPIRNLRDNRTLAQEVEELLADGVREGRDEHAEGGHLGREEEEC